MVASLQKAKQTKAIIERIQNLNLPPDELAVDIESVYKGQNLLTEAIEVLKERVKAKTQNPTIYRLLGDRYLNVGSPEQARREYKMAIQYAKIRGNLNELAQAQAGLELLLQSQLPTRTNPDQK
jgi:tetratricopeptide (TPR) repeat protein